MPTADLFARRRASTSLRLLGPLVGVGALVAGVRLLGRRPASRLVTRAVTINRPMSEVAPHVPAGARVSPGPGNHGTEVRVQVDDPPVSGPVSLAARARGLTPAQHMARELRELKARLECGEVPRA